MRLREAREGGNYQGPSPPSGGMVNKLTNEEKNKIGQAQGKSTLGVEKRGCGKKNSSIQSLKQNSRKTFIGKKQQKT